MQIRRATRDDVAAIVRMLADDDLGATRERFEPPLPDSYYAAFTAIDQDERQELVVVERDGEVIGTLQLTYIAGLSYQGSWRAQIEAVRVDARYRGAGIGSTLVRWAIERARARGCYLVQLTSNASRTEAHRFYERLGFTPSHVGMKLNLRSAS